MWTHSWSRPTIIQAFSNRRLKKKRVPRENSLCEQGQPRHSRGHLADLITFNFSSDCVTFCFVIQQIGRIRAHLSQSSRSNLRFPLFTREHRPGSPKLTHLTPSSLPISNPPLIQKYLLLWDSQWIIKVICVEAKFCLST